MKRKGAELSERLVQYSVNVVRLVQSLPEHLQGSLPTIAELEAELEKAEEENR